MLKIWYADQLFCLYFTFNAGIRDCFCLKVVAALILDEEKFFIIFFVSNKQKFKNRRSLNIWGQSYKRNLVLNRLLSFRAHYLNLDLTIGLLYSKLLMHCYDLNQGSQTQISVRATFWTKTSLRAAYGEKCLRGPQKAVKSAGFRYNNKVILMMTQAA